MLKDINIKLLSFLFAIFLWFIVTSTDYTEVSIYVPIKLLNVPENYIAVSEDKIVNIVLRGTNMILKSMSKNDIFIAIDVSNFKVGNIKYDIMMGDIKVPTGVEIKRIEPTNIHIVIDSMVSKKMEVIPFFIGTPKGGYRLSNIAISPNEIAVFGAKSRIESVNYIETLPIILTNEYQEKNINIGLNLKEGITETNPPEVKVILAFNENIIEKEFLDVPLIVKNSKNLKIVKMHPQSVRVKIEGRSDLINLDLADLLEVFIELNDIVNSGTYIRHVVCVSKQGVNIIHIIPNVVRLEVEK